MCKHIAEMQKPSPSRKYFLLSYTEYSQQFPRSCQLLKNLSYLQKCNPLTESTTSIWQLNEVEIWGPRHFDSLPINKSPFPVDWLFNPIPSGHSYFSVSFPFIGISNKLLASQCQILLYPINTSWYGMWPKKLVMRWEFRVITFRPGWQLESHS